MVVFPEGVWWGFGFCFSDRYAPCVRAHFSKPTVCVRLGLAPQHPIHQSGAVFHCTIKSLSRSRGRSASGAAAYISASTATDHYPENPVHFDYTKKAKPVGQLIVWHESVKTPAEFGALLDSQENRKNSVTAREIIVALPHSLTDLKRREIVEQLGDKIVARWEAPAIAAIHRPDRGGDQKNDHVHFLISTRDFGGQKIRKLDVKQTSIDEVAWLREATSQTIQAALPEAEWAEWDHRSYEAQGIDKAPTKHEGPLVTKMRKKGLRLDRARANDTISWSNQAKVIRAGFEPGGEQVDSIRRPSGMLSCPTPKEPKPEVETAPLRRPSGMLELPKAPEPAPDLDW